MSEQVSTKFQFKILQKKSKPEPHVAFMQKSIPVLRHLKTDFAAHTHTL